MTEGVFLAGNRLNTYIFKDLTLPGGDNFRQLDFADLLLLLAEANEC